VVPTALLLLLSLTGPLQDDPKISAILDRLRDPDLRSRRAAEAELAAAGAAAVPAALRVLARETAGLDARVDALVKRLASPAWKDRDAASAELVRLGRKARARLETHEAAADPEVAWRVKSILAELQERDKSEVTAELRQDAALCRFLGASGDARAVDLLLRVPARAAEAGTPEAILDVRRSAIEGLAALRASLTPEQADRTTEEALKLFASERRDRTTFAILLRTLGKLRSSAAVRPLTMLLEDGSEKDLHIKRGAMAALASIGDPSGVQAVARMLRSDDPYLREGALQVLADAAGTDFGIDPAAGPAPDEAFGRVRGWWEKKYGRGWDSDSK
jgi:hypothetical protein